MNTTFRFFVVFFGFVNNENRAENDFLKAELSSDFHSFKNSPKGDQEVEPEHGRWDQRID